MKEVLYRILSALLALIQSVCVSFGWNFNFGDEITVIENEKSTYIISYKTEDEKVAAFTMQEQLEKLCEVSLNVSENRQETEINFSSCDENKTGNYGYKIHVEDERIIVNASSLAGFDMAIERLLNDTVSDKSMKVKQFYTAFEKLNWQSDYRIKGLDYNPDYLNDTFYNDKNDSVAYVSNAMWHMFGLVDDGQDLVYRFGNEPTYFEWMSEKMYWSNDTAYKNELKDKIQNFPQTSTGYMWSWATQPYWPSGDKGALHYDGTFRYISAVHDIITWENNTDFLKAIDNTADNGTYSDMDSSYNKTVFEKTESCLNYILEFLDGKNGYVQNTEKSVYLNEDGTFRFDFNREIGEHIWNNTGKMNSGTSNYWDNLCFGNLSAYENALFYQSLNSMIGIYRMLGDDYAAKADKLEILAEKAKENFNKLFWSEEKGRYIACIDTDGNKIDYGFTFVNFEAMKYGLSDKRQSKLIFDWIDGDRIIEGEDKTGDEILSYAEIMKPVSPLKYLQTKNLYLAATANTIALDNKENKKTRIAWWDAPDSIDIWKNAGYGCHLENGGYIFYPVFYELMARTEFEGAQSTTNRLSDISKVYEYNRLKSDVKPAVNGVEWVEGLIGEFPESGLVPTVYLYSLLGINAKNTGLHISPAFNDVYETMGVKNFVYAGLNYSIELKRDASMTIKSEDGLIDIDLVYTPERFSNKCFNVLLDGKKLYNVTPDENGQIKLSFDGIKAHEITIIHAL